jgi:hypothetical protein
MTEYTGGNDCLDIKGQFGAELNLVWVSDRGAEIIVHNDDEFSWSGIHLNSDQLLKLATTILSGLLSLTSAPSGGGANATTDGGGGAAGSAMVVRSQHHEGSGWSYVVGEGAADPV